MDKRLLLLVAGACRLLAVGSCMLAAGNSCCQRCSRREQQVLRKYSKNKLPLQQQQQQTAMTAAAGHQERVAESAAGLGFASIPHEVNSLPFQRPCKLQNK